MNEMKESKAMQEVRAWKAECDAEVAHLDVAHAVRKRLADSAKAAAQFGFRYEQTAHSQISVVAERKETYGKT